MIRHAQQRGLGAAAAVAALAVAASGGWSRQLAPGARFLPVAAVAATFAAGWLTRRLAAGAFLAWLPAAILMAGAPAAALKPRAWPELIGHLAAGGVQLITTDSRPASGPWPLAAALLGGGALWISGAAVATIAAWSPRWKTVAFLLLAAPCIAAVTLAAGDRAAWLGALVLVAGLLWFRASLAVLAVGAAAALLSVGLAQALGPRTPWFGLGGRHAHESPFRTLDTLPTYGPLQGRRIGATMLEIHAPEPALWRMQTLDEFDGTEWTLSSHYPRLPQPAARAENVDVHVLGLRDDLVVGPGRIQRVIASGRTVQVLGEGWRVPSDLHTGSTYRVSADHVDASASQLARDRTPLDPRARMYARLQSAPRDPSGLEWIGGLVFGTALSYARPSAPDPRVLALARRLSAGAHSEWEVVTRVERYLLDGGRFHYTTQVPTPRPQPLDDFLLRTHAGYCQHFAGAAALLLRAAGVPARVVVGFATGKQIAPGTYSVRDLDAHEWIEVYFQRYGWVPFNPTPAAARATIAAGIDPLNASPPRAPGGRSWGTGLALGALIALAAASLIRRRGRRRAPDRLLERLERIARRGGARILPSTTLGELAAALSRLGPRTAALATEIERARFAPTAPAAGRLTRVRLVRALAADAGVVSALLVYLPVRRPRRLTSVDDART